MNISVWALRHPVPVAVVTAGAFLFGILALFSLNREFIPPMVMPSSTVVSLWPGVAAEDVERDVTSVLEDRFSTMAGLTGMTSASREGVSIIMLRYSEDIDDAAILLELRNRVDQAAADLPSDMLDKPMVSTWGASDLPVFTFAAAAPVDADRLSRFVEDVLIPELYKVEGVARARMLGDSKTTMEIRLDPAAAGAANVALTEVIGAVQSRNRAIPAGMVEWKGAEWAFRVSGEFDDSEQIGRLVVGRAGASPVRIDDIGRIIEAPERADERIRSGGADLIVVQVTKRESGNAIRMSRDIRSRLESLEASEGMPLDFTVLHDDAEIIRTSLNAVVRSAVAGIIMAIAVLWLFLLNWRYTLAIAISLPVSLVLAFAGMRAAGQSVNVLTLAGITVSLGMIVDASIVVLENIHRRHGLGDDGPQAAMAGARSVSGAVIAATTTSVCVFVPMLFLKGIIGNVMKDLSITIVLCLGASLFAALMLVPPLAGRILSASSKRSSSGNRTGGVLKKLEAGYRKALERSLGMSRTVIAAASVVLVLSVLSADMMGISFIPSADYDEVYLSLELRPGATLDESVRAADRAEAAVRAALPELEDAFFYVGMEDDLAGDARRRESVWGHLLLKSSRFRKKDFQDVIDELNRFLPETLPGVGITVLNGGFDRMVAIGTEGTGYRVELSSESWPNLLAAADQVDGLLRSDPQIVGTTRDVRENRRFITARLDDEALDHSGVALLDAAMAARAAFDGYDAGVLRPVDGSDRDIRISTRLEGAVPDSSALLEVPVRDARGRIISLDSLADVRTGTGVSGIQRRNRARTITVVGTPRDENIRDIDRRLKDSLAAHPLPEGVDWSVEGVGGLIGDSLGDLGTVLLAALFLVYAVMAIQFERLVQPLIIMASVPFSFIGVVLGLGLFGSSLSLISFLGIIALGGIVVNNAIIQIDRMNQLRAAGASLDEAVLEGAATRLRPILMTTLTTFIGVLPLSLARGGGARIYAPLGQAIAGGLVSSTLVTLFLIPSLYRIVEAQRSRSGASGQIAVDEDSDTGAA